MPLPTTPDRAAKAMAFLEQVKAVPRAGSGRGRLIFALDATASREGTWDQACRVQGEMFEATAGIGELDLQLVFFRGFGECKNSRWMVSAGELHRAMRSVSCVGGLTQIERVLTHTIRETENRKVNALIFVGDAMEEKADQLRGHAGKLGSLGTPIFIFQEGDDANAATTFKQIASLSRGAYLAFDLASIDRLKELLGAIAVFATGNRVALEAYGKQKGSEVLRLTAQLQEP